MPTATGARPQYRTAVFVDGDYVVHAARLLPSSFAGLISVLRREFAPTGRLEAFFSSNGRWGDYRSETTAAGATFHMVRQPDTDIGLRMMETILKDGYDEIVVVSGDGDLASAVEYAQFLGVIVTVASPGRMNPTLAASTASTSRVIEFVVASETTDTPDPIPTSGIGSAINVAPFRVAVQSVGDELIRYLAANPTAMYQLDPRKFEELMAELYRRQGFEVELTQQTRDGGVDLYVISSAPSGKALTLVEVKRYRADRPVGVGIVRAHYGVIEAIRATAGVVATTSFFTADAHEFRESVKCRLGLRDYLGVQAMLRAGAAQRLSESSS
jgi:hypothetical protein